MHKLFFCCWRLSYAVSTSLLIWMNVLRAGLSVNVFGGGLVLSRLPKANRDVRASMPFVELSLSLMLIAKHQHDKVYLRFQHS